MPRRKQQSKIAKGCSLFNVRCPSTPVPDEDALLKEHSGWIAMLARRAYHTLHKVTGMDSEDIKQMTTFAALRAIRTYDKTAKAKLVTWISHMHNFCVRNALVEANRQKRMGSRIVVDPDIGVDREVHDRHEFVEEEFVEVALRQAHLHREDQEVIERCVLNGESGIKLAKKKGVSRAMIFFRRKRALDRLKEVMRSA